MTFRLRVGLLDLLAIDLVCAAPEDARRLAAPDGPADPPETIEVRDVTPETRASPLALPGGETAPEARGSSGRSPAGEPPRPGAGRRRSRRRRR